MAKATTKSQKTAPDALSTEAQAWVDRVLTDFVLEEHHKTLLLMAAQAWDTGKRARAALHEHGLIYQDRFGQPHARPEVGIERDSKILFARLLRELALDIDGPAEVAARPPAIQPSVGLKIAGGR